MNRDFRPYEGQFFGVFGNLNLNPYTHKGSAPERHTEPRSGPGKAVSTQPHPLEVSPTKVRPSEVDDKVCKGILDEISEASPDREWLYCTEGDVSVRFVDWLVFNPGRVAMFGSAEDADVHGTLPASMVTLGHCKACAKLARYTSVCLVDTNLNVLKEWKV